MSKPNASVMVKTLEEIADEYGYCRQTFWRKRKGRSIILPKGIVSLKSQKIIYERMGYPPGISKENYENV